MRIIAGKHRGRRIISIEGKTIRPTTGKAREAIFSIITSGSFLDENGDSILDGAIVADICCGTGAVGLEALSRGAKQVIFIDSDSGAIQLVKDNLAAFKEETSTKALRADAISLPNAQQRCQVVFIDPPYDSKIVPAILKSLESRNWLAENAVIICEVSRMEAPSLPENYRIINERHYGRTKVLILRWQTNPVDVNL